MKLKNIWVTASFLLMFVALTEASNPIQSVRVILPSNAGSITKRISEILSREITERCSASVSLEDDATLTVELAVERGIGTEGFKIADHKGVICITGNDENGLLYGVGKFLHTSGYSQEGFTPSVWRGTSVPKGKVRGIYFATHFDNFYEAATTVEVQRYVDDIALWGVNTLAVWFMVDQFKSFEDTRAQKNLARLRELMIAAKNIGLKVALLGVWNTGFPSVSKEIRGIDNSSQHAGFSGVMVCPSNPVGREYLRNLNEQVLSEFLNINIDYVIHWPYDPGGCGCSQCSPWGACGYIGLSKEVTSQVKAKFPGCKSILSTWCYDYGVDWSTSDTTNMIEWEGLTKALAQDKSWVDYIMADAHTDFPGYPLKIGVPRGLPMLNFPEISMWGQSPWGGYGANPLPQRFQRLWNQVKGKVVGGFPYSEGIYEDINKVICSQFYWDPNCSAEETVKDYISYEFSPSVVQDVWKAIQILEHNHDRKKIAQSAEEAFRLIEKSDVKLTPQMRKSWRWRLIYLRSKIDRELFRNGGKLEGVDIKAAFEEITRIGHSENALECLHPPKIVDPNAKDNPVSKGLN